jgi:polyhydroxyalkanoate synthesis regulator phasin
MLGVQAGSSSQSSSSKPAFLWVLRDCQLQFKQEPKAEMTEKLEDAQLRKLKRSFREYDCVPLPHPVDGKSQLQEVDSMDFNSLKADFVEEFFLLDRMVFKHAGVKPTAGGRAITGSMVGDMVTKYLDSIKMRSGMLTAISEIPTQAQLIAKMAAERAIKTAKEKYEQGIQGVQNQLPLPLACLHQQHLRCLAEAETTLIDTAIGVEEAGRRLLLHDLRQFVAEEESLLSFRPDFAIFVNESMLKGGFLRILQRNEELSSQAASVLFSTLYDPIGKGCREEPCEYASVEAFDAAVAALKVSLLEESCKQGVEAAMVYLLASNPRIVKDRETIIFSRLDAKFQAMQQQHAQEIELLKTETHEAIAKETSERSKAVDECAKLRAELEGHNKAHGATVTEIRDKINTVKTEAKAALDTVEKDLNEKLSSCAGSLESAKTELTKNVDAKVDALEEKIQGLKKGAEDLEEDIGKILSQVKDGAERALGAAKGALLEALETHKVESLTALQTAKTELTKEREEAEGKTTAAREALGTAIRVEMKAEHDAWVQQLKLHSDARHQLEKSLSAAIAQETSERGKELVKATDEYGKLRAELEGEKSSSKRVRDALDKELRTAIENAGKFGKQQLSSVKEQIDVEIKATKAGAKTTAEQVVQIQSEVLKLGASANALRADGQKLKQQAALACGAAGLHYLYLLSVFSIYLCTQTHTTYTYSRRADQVVALGPRSAQRDAQRGAQGRVAAQTGDDCNSGGRA